MKKPDVLTEAQLDKKLSGLSADEVRNLLRQMFDSSDALQKGLSFYFKGQGYRSDLLEWYCNTISAVFHPSETALMREGVDISKAKGLLAEWESSVFTGDMSTDQYYKACA